MNLLSSKGVEYNIPDDQTAETNEDDLNFLRGLLNE
jgi:hypothetical protein